MKKKIFIGIAVLFVFHFVTWKIWGEEKFLKKGFYTLEEMSSCKGYQVIENLDGVDYKLEPVRFNISSLTKDAIDDSVSLVILNDKSLMVLGYRKDIYTRIRSEIDTTTSYPLLFIVSRDWIPQNPYFNDALFYCWAFGTDDIFSEEPLLIWAFVGWIDVANRYTYPIYERYVDNRIRKERE